MKRFALFTALLLVVTVASAGPPKEVVIEAGSKYTEDVKIDVGNVRVMDGAEMRGNIFIEEGDLFIGSEVNIVGSITCSVKKGTIRVMEDADVAGNIFIEEGDLFLASGAAVMGAITIKKGNIFIKDRVHVAREILLLNGNVDMGSGCEVEDGIMAGGGAVSMRDGNSVHGDIKAAKLTQGQNNDIRGKFIKTP